MDEELDQLASDFAVNYLAKKGIAEEDILDENGQLDPEVRDHIISLMDQGGDRSAFLAEYKADPEGKLKSVIDAEDEIQSAKKGAKLNKLNKLKQFKKGAPMMKKKKCACGCAMIDKKEEGGKMISKCSCGCKGVQKHADGGYFNSDGVFTSFPAPTTSGIGSWWNENITNRKPRVWVSGKGWTTNNVPTPAPATTAKSSNGQANYIMRNAPAYQMPGITKGQYTSLIPSSKPEVAKTAKVAEATPVLTPIKGTGEIPSNKPNPNVSIVDYLGTIGQNSSMAARKKLAAEAGFKNYKGTANENLRLIDIIRAKQAPLASTGVTSVQVNNTKPVTMMQGIAQLPLQKATLMKEGGTVDKKENYLAALAKKKQAPKVVKKTKK